MLISLQLKLLYIPSPISQIATQHNTSSLTLPTLISLKKKTSNTIFINSNTCYYKYYYYYYQLSFHNIKKMTLSKKATCNSHGQDSSYFLGWQEYEKNPYDESLNPKGIIQMGLAENQVYIYIYMPKSQNIKINYFY